MKRLLILLISLFSMQVFAQSTVPLTVHSSGRYLEANGKPFFMVGDAGWSLFVEINKADVDFYFDVRRSLGFNTVLCNLIEHLFCSNPPANIYGDRPFTGTAFKSTPNEAYFQHADYVVASAEQRGVYLLLAPVYVGYGGAGTDQGWWDEIIAATTTEMREWGRYIGNRYKNYTNIIWVIGGDWNTTSAMRTKLSEVVLGIQEYIPNAIFTAHNAPETYATQGWGRTSWLTLNNIYTYDENSLISKSQTCYNLTPPYLFFMLEGGYEGESGTPLKLRQQAYLPTLSGGMGHIYGNRPMWFFGSGWKSALYSSGSYFMDYWQRLMNSREWYNLVPDFSHNILTASNYSNVATAASNKSIIAYMSSNRTVTINSNGIAGSQIKVWWYKPSDGTSSLVGTYDKGSRSFTPPGSGDWVIVVDDAALGLPAPGSPLTDVVDREDFLTFGLNQNYPNPFNGTTTIQYSLPVESLVDLTIYNIIGQEVEALVRDTQQPGQYSVVWDASSYPSGTYVIRIQVNDYIHQTRKATYLK